MRYVIAATGLTFAFAPPTAQAPVAASAPPIWSAFSRWYRLGAIPTISGQSPVKPRESMISLKSGRVSR